MSCKVWHFTYRGVAFALFKCGIREQLTQSWHRNDNSGLANYSEIKSYTINAATNAKIA